MSQKESLSSKSTRREFLGKTAAAVVSGSLLTGARGGAAKTKPIPTATGRVLGANDRIRLGFIGCGMQLHRLLRRGFEERMKNKGDFEYSAMCDVWEPRLKHAQEKTKAEKTYRD